ncbi:FACT complex subunit SPT16 [Vairimorpha necatrix]|uniref:FACT complex subunit n=1 Tax=Vairimorpha necatrix TaxID=6039 RepID=A0AAX4JFY7_9MICR
MTEIKIDPLKFSLRIDKIRKLIPDPLLIILGSKSDLEQANLNSALSNYLIGYEFPNTMILIDNQVRIYSNKKKLDLLRILSNCDLFPLEKDFSNIQEIIKSLSIFPKLCLVDKNKIQGFLSENILNTLICEDVSYKIEKLFLYKDEDELINCKKAGLVINHLIKNCTELIKENNLEEDKLEEIIDMPLDGIDNENIEYSFPPEISKYSYRIGIRYNGYCAEGGRTIFQDMNIFYNAQKFILSLIRVGDNSKIVYEKVKEYLKSNDLEVDDNFLYTTGLLNEEVNFKNEFRILNGLVFVLRLSNGVSILSNTFFMDEIPIFLTISDKFEDFLDQRPRFRDKSREFELDVRRKEHQKELLEKLINERLEYYKNKRNNVLEEDKNENIPYLKENLIPRKGKIYVDFNNNCVCLPISDFILPIHISSIKNIVLVDETILKINITCNSVNNSLLKSNSTTNISDNNYVSNSILKSINVIINSGRQIYEEIQELKNKFTLSSDKEIIKQDKLIEKSSKFILEDLFLRTDIKTPIKKRKSNTLECHENGFRFLEDKLDILFSNIKNIFFLKGDVQNKTILHFNLISPIIINNKKTKNIQFYQEASANITFNTNKRGDDHMEYLIEKEEKDKQKRLNYLFENFVMKIENETFLKVQRPKDGFTGVPFKESVFIQKTHECLVALYEQPFFILNLEDIEVCNFERVVYNVKTYDVIFIFKDYTTSKILSIESSYMSKFKDYLDYHNIVYMETIFNIQWKNVLKKIQDDPIGFYSTGGWTELLVEDNESEEEVEESEEESESESSEEESDISTVSSSFSEDTESSEEEEEESSEEMSDSSDEGRKRRRR